MMATRPLVRSASMLALLDRLWQLDFGESSVRKYANLVACLANHNLLSRLDDVF